MEEHSKLRWVVWTKHTTVNGLNALDTMRPRFSGWLFDVDRCGKCQNLRRPCQPGRRRVIVKIQDAHLGPSMFNVQRPLF
jgi:hypothetical protein